MATLKGVFPEPKVNRRKNFIHENVKNLRRMEHYFHNHKEVEELQKLQIRRQQKASNRYQNIASRVNSSLREAKDEDFSDKTCTSTAKQKLDGPEKSKSQAQPHSKNSAPTLQSKTTAGVQKGFMVLHSNAKSPILKRKTREAVLNKKLQSNMTKAPSDPNLNCGHCCNSNTEVKYRSQGIQTLDAKHMSNLYAEGTIRYSTRRSPRLDLAMCKTMEVALQNDKTPREGANSPSDRGDVSSAPSSPSPKSPDLHLDSSREEGTDFVKLNKQQTSIATKMATQLNNGVPPTHYRKGVVPKYLRERKEAQLQKEQKAKEEAPDPDCPDGHVPLPDSERQETLRMLKKNYQEFVKELNMMPIKTDTLRSQKRKMEIEKQLNKIEEGIKVFSRPKVYVKINA
ncbi:uncharacterized protein LOC124303261 isoform X1 [Neodiprion virginianus]|uniref:uncharacterized protein LOC124303261 isoform X1 n=1 Tax=Neodiprion virginianus TaxID=2961670 RepID=UPI001EE6C7A0|nr:uncharacterized protein LOC124303261 isoform X1 [Neodiprion virginianus]